MINLSLDRQIHIYSFDTSAFYTDEEKALEVEINKHCSSKSKLKSEREIIEQLCAGEIAREKAESQFRKLYGMGRSDPIPVAMDNSRVKQIAKEIRGTNQMIKIKKSELVSLLQAHRSQRELRTEYVVDKNVISVLSRCLQEHSAWKQENCMTISWLFAHIILM